MSIVISNGSGSILDHNAAVACAYCCCHLAEQVSGVTSEGCQTTHSGPADTEVHIVSKDSGEEHPFHSSEEMVSRKSHSWALCWDIHEKELKADDSMHPLKGKAMESLSNVENTCNVKEPSNSAKHPQHYSNTSTKVEQESEVSLHGALADVKTDVKESCSKCDCQLTDVGIASVHPPKFSQKITSLQLQKGFFTLYVPFMMDSQFEKVHKCLTERHLTLNGDTNITVGDIKQILIEKRKKRKRSAAHGSAEEDRERERLTRVHRSLISIAGQQGMFQKSLPTPLDNNLLSRKCAQIDSTDDCFQELLLNGDGISLHNAASQQDKVRKSMIINPSGRCSFSAEELIHRRVEHPQSTSSVVRVGSTEFILPPHSVFLLSTLKSFCSHLYSDIADDRYDLIVVDPPWENKSVKRKKSYDMVGESTLQELPLSRLTQAGSLVALWVTNNDRLEEFAVEELFPAWGVRLVARWHWLKITQTGDTVTSMTEGHKKPYEILLLGKVVSQQCSAGLDQQDTITGSSLQDPPQSHVIISVPCSLHSKKVPLADVLMPYLPENPRCLELFARNLWPGWTSWGREALRHQNRIFFEEVDTACSVNVT